LVLDVVDNALDDLLDLVRRQCGRWLRGTHHDYDLDNHEHYHKDREKFHAVCLIFWQEPREAGEWGALTNHGFHSIRLKLLLSSVLGNFSELVEVLHRRRRCSDFSD